MRERRRGQERRRRGRGRRSESTAGGGLDVCADVCNLPPIDFNPPGQAGAAIHT
jgi:hypothetical protein